MTAVVVLLLLALSGLPLARRIAGTSVEAVVLAPLLGAAFLAGAAVVLVAVGGPLLVLGTFALIMGAVLPLLFRPPPRTEAPGLKPAELVLLLGPCTVLVWTLGALERYHLGWDARSIWFFHGRMLMTGQDGYLDLSAVYGWSHPDYPPLIPASLAYTWQLTSALDYRTGQVLVAALIACGTVLAGLAVARAQRSPWIGAVAATASVAICYGVWDASATNGYVDALVASLVLAGAGYGLLARPSARHDQIALACLLVAALTKNEGLSWAVVIMGLVLVRVLLRRRQGQAGAPAWGFALTVGAAALWPLTVRAHGLSGAPVASRSGTEAADRLSTTLDTLLPTLHDGLWAVACLLLVAVLLGWRATAGGFAFAVALLACTSVLLSVYVFGRHEIEWWLHTSLGRTSMFLRAGGVLLAVFTAGVLVEWLLRGRAEEAEASRRSPAPDPDVVEQGDPSLLPQAPVASPGGGARTG